MPLILWLDKVLNEKGIGVCCREMDDNKALPNPYLWILGGPHADVGSNLLYASNNEAISAEPDALDEPDPLQPQILTANFPSNSDDPNSIFDEGKIKIPQLNLVKGSTSGEENNPDLNADSTKSLDSDVNIKRKRVSSRPMIHP